MPHVMRLVATTPTPTEITDLLDICSPDDEDGSEHVKSGQDMRQAFFNREDLNASRVKYALALWCSVSLSSFLRIVLMSRADIQPTERNLVKQQRLPCGVLWLPTSGLLLSLLQEMVLW